MLKRLLLTALPLAAIVAVPILLRKDAVANNPDARQLVIISPHNEAIRYEFERAFRIYCRDRFGDDIDIDWRTPGGTSEIVQFLRSSYTAVFRSYWTREKRGEWTQAVQNAFMNRKLRQGDASEEEWAARQAFLDSNIDIGVDCLFGGGQYDLGHLASQGILVPCGLRDRHPELFTGEQPILSTGLSGEIWCDSADRYYGACLSSFGICYNPDCLVQLGYTAGPSAEVPRQWKDLADARLFGQLGIADPSKSGSIMKCFEMLIQQQMAEEVSSLPPSEQQKSDAVAAAVGRGWYNAMLLIRKIGGNARFFTFSAGKVPLSVARGEVAAGMCIDFYGRSQADWEEKHMNRTVMVYVPPTGGSSVSADPIGILRGAPHRELADAFLDFVFSPEGQRLWNYRTGTEGGPETYALRRLPIRRDCYTDSDREKMSDPDADPFALAENFTYHPEWTGPLFNLSRNLIRVMVIDCHPELSQAWHAILNAGGPEHVPEALIPFGKLPFEFSAAAETAARIGNPVERVKLCREWTVFFKKAYQEAAAAAETTVALQH